MAAPLDYEKPARRRAMQNKLRQALVISGIANVLILLLASTVLDTGVVLSIAVGVCGGYWAAVVLILERRRNALTRFDLLFVAFGYPMLVFPILIGLLGW